MGTLIHPLDRHFSLPAIRHVETSRPLAWLKAGWLDLRSNLGASISYGLLLSAIGYLILGYAAELPYLLTAAISGFFLVGPLAAAGLYEISRLHESGQKPSFAASLAGLRQEAGSLMFFGFILAFALISWERISAILFALFFTGNLRDLNHFVKAVLLSGEHIQFVMIYLISGGALAALVFALSVVAIPMLLDRKVDVVTAMMASLRSVAQNPGPMLVWAALLVTLIAIGFASMMTGMVVLLPLLGHASWHAYRDLVQE